MTKGKRTPTIENRKAYHDYFIEETLECGIELRGNEVKSLREGKASIKEAWVAIENNEMLIKKMHITKWDTANLFDVDENRERNYLLIRVKSKSLIEKLSYRGILLYH